MKSLITNAISALEVRFSSFDLNEVLKATAVFSPTTWPSDPTALARFGYDQIHLLSTHFSQALERGYIPESCIEEWPELKRRVQEIRTLEPTVKYLHVYIWQRILNETLPSLTNILALLRITLIIPVQTATLERGFSLMKRIKSDWRNRLKPEKLLQLMMIKLNGPDLEKFDTQPAISLWWNEGSRSHRSGSKPYGPRPLHETESTSSDSLHEPESASSHSDSELDSVSVLQH